ncbi:hypothetical protein LSCM1_08096 [Leishmania martiniquensis]|uniref:Uncharacterized protein n=1 Tax=Leishmania martiniquensis TaxID=1580590 RepID=A0A836KUQ3_9TRYP|nr:hypothetical protein LSCM1_08096 [Leishmania martiniquensis]
MSSDFETLSCNVESSEGRRGCSISSDFDTLDDLVAEQDAQLLRRLSIRSAAPRAGDRHAPSRDPSGIHSTRRASAMYGGRNYGVAGEVAPTTPAVRGSLYRQHGEAEYGRHPAAAQRGAAATGGLHADADVWCGDDGGGMHPCTKGPTGCGDPPAAVVASRNSETASRARAAAAHASGSRDGEPGWATQRQATCPPDSGTHTPVTSAAGIVASAAARGTHTSHNGHDCEDDGGVEQEQDGVLGNGHEVLHGRRAHDVRTSAVASRPPPSAAPPRRRAQDFDGFYNTGLLLEEDDDDEGVERGLSRCHDRAFESAAVLPSSAVSGTSPLNTHRPYGQRGIDAPPTPPCSEASTTASYPHAGGHTLDAASPTPANASTAHVPRSWSLASRRKAAGDQLCRLALALPNMTAVHWLSLVITLLVPVNLLCLDVMALGWIRRRVDVSYGGASAPPSPDRSTVPTPSRMGICSGAGASTRAAAASPSCANGSSFASRVDAATDLSTSGSGRSTRGTASAGDSGRAGTPRASSPSSHTVPTLCSVILWLLAPNGLLCRLFIYRLRRPGRQPPNGDKEAQDELVEGPSPSATASASPTTSVPTRRAAAASTDEYRHLKAEWQACCDAYERVRRLAPQLEVIEVFLRYACLWLMVHAALPCATAASEWTDAWLLKAPVPDEEDAAPAQSGSGWRAAIDATAPVSPRRAADALACD